MAGADSSKKLIPMKILEILRKRTDVTHTMDQKEILDELNKSYDPPLDRKTVRRNIGFLIEMGFPVYYEVKPRKNGNDIWTDGQLVVNGGTHSYDASKVSQNNATGITTLQRNDVISNEAVIYDLNGRRIDMFDGRKGVFIIRKDNEIRKVIVQ